MQTREPIDAGSLGPEELSTLYKAFDAAWAVERNHYNADNPVSTDVGRLRLANAVLAAYRNGLVDPDLISAQALVSMGVWHGPLATDRPATEHKMPRPVMTGA